MIKKIFLAPLAVYAILSLSTLPVMAQTAILQSENQIPPRIDDTKEAEKRQEKKVERKDERKVDLACMQAAVEKRDNALLATVDARYSAHKAALTARRDALKAAWGMTDAAKRREALQAAWKAYREALEKSTKAFRDAKKSAWKQFKEDRRACKSEGASEDKVTEGTDGQL